MSVETKTERDVNIMTGAPVVRLFYRREGERRWQRKLVFVEEGQTPEQIEGLADQIAEKLLAGASRG